MSFVYKGATISARELTIEDDDQIARLTSKLPTGTIANSGTPFMEFMIGAEVEGEPPIPRVTTDSLPDEVEEAYEAWKALPRRFLKLWRQELESVESPNGSATQT